MEDLDFEQLKISALKKLQHIQLNSPRTINTKSKLTISQQDASEKGKIKTNYVTSFGIPVRSVIKEMEIQRQAKVKNAVEARLNKLTQFSTMCGENTGQEWLKQQQSFINSQLQNERIILNSLSQYDQDSSSKKEKLNQYYQNLQEQRRNQEDELKAKEKLQKLLKENVDKIKSCYIEFCSVYQSIINIIKSCVSQEELKMLSLELKRAPALRDNFEDVIKKCKAYTVTETEVKRAADILLELKVLKEKFETVVNSINLKASEAKAAPPVEEPKEPVAVVKPASQPSAPKDVPDVATSQVNLSKFVGLRNLKMYTDLMDFMDSHVSSFRDLVEDNSLKQFKFDCKKAINIPVNAISAVNSSHLLDKYNRLHKLLSGQTVVVSEQQINAAKHPKGIVFCLDLLAQKFVLQCDLMISSNPESAFCYATIISSLWNDFPVLGKLVLGYLYKSCPYLVPYYIPHNVGESQEEFYQRRGYQYINGQIEKQDKFLKRMTGIMRLYAALLITKPKRGQTKIPHNIENGWRWIASILKLEPELDITATMLHVFLESAGFAMEQTYGRAFKKVMRIVIEQFLPICGKQCTGGAVTRLELLLSEYVKNGRFEKPNGYTSTANW